MYFFLINLSVLDLGSISLTVPKSVANSLLNTMSISYAGCVTQVFLFIFFTAVDFAILTIVAYYSYVAICQPLHCEMTMNRRACVQMAASAWITGILLSVLHTGNTFAITFCGGNMVGQFYCEIPQILKLACSDLYLGETVVLSFNLFLGLSCFGFIFVSYVQIFKIVLRIHSEQGWHKAFSTYLSHLTVVSLLFCTAVIAYVKPTSLSPSGLDLVFLGIYPAALTGNRLIITAIALSHHLHTLMYFFLKNLSVLDLSSISIVVPKSIANSLMSTRAITYYGFFAYVKPTSHSPSGLDFVVSVLYSVVPPLMNPIIYSMRNKEIKGVLKKLTERRLFTKNKISRYLP
ncbi:olfactory receptor 14A16-like [Chrysemys picta bellii]|uniref:olfactory receptor 14A16-like n=1 Tax=Chrysemys picta bellii TaxID=8478 RepID=UPI0032B21BA2